MKVRTFHKSTTNIADLALTLSAWTPAQAAETEILLKILSNPYRDAMRDGIVLPPVTSKIVQPEAVGRMRSGLMERS
ncbi:hypothetical protein [Caballeronia sp. KNU42]